ncbi:hypothetical protein BH11CYA1_BH11CYA1_15250 [soil metagenome]
MELAAKSSDQIKDSSKVESFTLNFATTAESQRNAVQEMTKLAGDASTLLPKVDLDFSTTSNDKPESTAVKEALSAYKENGPAAALKLMREDLAAFEKDAKLTYSLPVERGGAGFDLETANSLAEERSGKRWQAVKDALLKEDPTAMEKLKVAYLDDTVKAMSAAGGRYGNLDQYGVAAQSHFEKQKNDGASPMIRELAGQISKEYSSIANPRGTDTEGNRIDKRELEQYKVKQAQSW